MTTLTELWRGMDGRRRGFLIGGLAAIAVILVILTRLATAPSYELLYAGLDPAAASDVVAAVEARGVAYRVQGDTILVDSRERDALRMSLAGEGLPANGAAGYELLDGLSGFGTTSQMFDAAYWRAREGELARTIISSPRIRAARVHIANPGADPFQPARDVTASVALRPAAGGLAPGHAQALRYLVASSVPGLLPENVTILDADSGQVLGGADSMAPAADAAARAESLRRNIERLLAARVGPGNAVVQVNVELETMRETIVERRIDPDSRTAIATETDERTNTARDAASGGVTVASNLPEGDAGPGGSSSSEGSETRERVTFDMSELQREVAREPGDIRRISVAVLLNGVRTIGTDGIATVEPRPEAEIAALQALVQSAIGYTADRGDSVTIQSMAFEEMVPGDLVLPGFADRMSLDLGRVLQTLVLAAAALFIAFGLLRPMLRREPVAALSDPMAFATALPGAAPGYDRSLAAPVLAAGPAPLPSLAAPLGAVPQTMERAETAATGLPALPAALPAARGGDPVESLPDPVDRLRRLIEEREEETIEILRSWMEEDEGARP
ncbi:flagellar basal-body MS-ring/collar protein FliF [Roseicyclus mahoneyensis]|uniref:Flagellar M-ring protein n=1 Tax=Roseicyclus mahoneyensis TaxID=164332 RepID=A0A316GXJ1_9RHOB|nr:flagellar basal-body MS-ring/collar protein FliF [Roseicyclus mahoneyensis]PWK59813.1 flagellar M-ring protein FliF [Roseicyclus mahoneyensis]